MTHGGVEMESIETIEDDKCLLVWALPYSVTIFGDTFFGDG